MLRSLGVLVACTLMSSSFSSFGRFSISLNKFSVPVSLPSPSGILYPYLPFVMESDNPDRVLSLLKNLISPSSSTQIISRVH